MKVLLIILGIILFFILVLSVKVKVTVHSEDGIELSVGWLFLKFRILPLKEKKKKKKKEKKPKKEKKKDESEEASGELPEEENPEEEKSEEEKPKKKKGKKDNIFLRFYRNNGVSGVVELLGNLRTALGGMFRRIGRAFFFDELYISLLVGAGDSAETAIKYGKTCEKVYPAVGFLTSNMRVGRYSLDVNPDFIEGRNKARLHAKISVRPIRLINAVLMLLPPVTFKVVIKFLKGSRAKKPKAQEEKINTNSKEKGEKQ